MERPELLYQYQEIARVLKEQIVRGDFQKAGRLPSERLLVERFRVQRNTVRQALALLEKEGQILTERKRGSFLKGPENTFDGKCLLVNIHGGDSPNLSRLRDGFAHAATERGFDVRMVDSHPRKGAALDVIPNADELASDVAGAMVWPQNPTDVEALRKLKAKIPIVLVDRRVVGLSADCVRFGDLAGGEMVGQHLISLGHRKIAFISDDVFAETVQHRWRGYVTALEKNDIPIDPRLSLFFHGIDEPYFSLSLRHLLKLGNDAPTAIMCSNDVVAFSLLRFLHDEGIRVPDDLAVTGYGNMLPDYVNAMALTSVDQPFYNLGESAAKILIDRAGQVAAERIRSPHDIEIPVRLVVRGSSGSRSSSAPSAV